MTEMTTHTAIGLWATFKYRDANAMIDWLTAIGFTAMEVVHDPDDPNIVAHAEMRWPAGGGIMFGSYQPSSQWPTQPGTGATYLVTEDPDAVYEAAIAHGGTSLYEPRDEDYGGRAAGVADPEGNLWSFGSYAPR